jgi:hypothetical protein
MNKSLEPGSTTGQPTNGLHIWTEKAKKPTTTIHPNQ